MLLISRQFGGKLVTFSNSRGEVVIISQDHGTGLSPLLRAVGTLSLTACSCLLNFCDHKSQYSPNKRKRTLWNFLNVSVSIGGVCRANMRIIKYSYCIALPHISHPTITHWCRLIYICGQLSSYAPITIGGA